MKGSKQEDVAMGGLQTVKDMEEPHQLLLPHFYEDGDIGAIPRISKETLLEVIDGKFDGLYNNRMIVDCRFEYEFDGGHINGAVNYNDKAALTAQLFEEASPAKTLLIFHCEYSAHRAPLMAKYIRKQDRTTNVESYPKLTFPEVYILDGGYSTFFSEHPAFCFPQNYVEMDDAQHAHTCERLMGKLRKNTRNKLSRAATYAFGSSSGVDESPTAPSRAGRTGSSDLMMMDMTTSPLALSLSTSPQPRRMVSF